LKIISFLILVFIVFRGTVHNFRNWVANLRFSQTDAFPEIPNARVHHGFWISYKDLHHELLNVLNKLPKHKKIRLVGYSKGGAVANIGKNSNKFLTEHSCRKIGSFRF
jgi:surfactin synthase thioesterase subunit